MPVLVQQNLNNKETLVEANELIEFFLKADNPWAKFFPFKKTDSTEIKFRVKKPNTNIQKVTDKTARLDVGYADTDTIKKTIENMYTSGETILEVDLEADNGQDLQDTMKFEVSNNLDTQIAKDDTKAVSEYATVIDIEEDTPIGNLKAMLKAWDTAFQLGNTTNAKFFITSEQYDKLVYLADNKGLITDNSIAQQLRLNGTILFVKGVECQVNQDRYMTVGEKETVEKMPFVLATPLAMKRYYLMNAKIYREPVNDGKVPCMILVGGEVMSDAYPYMTKSEKTSRWLYKGKLKSGTSKPELETVIATSNLRLWEGKEDNPSNTELETQVKNKNSNYNNGDATFSVITASSALATANPKKYQGKVNLTYTYTKKEDTNLIKANAEIAALKQELQEAQQTLQEKEPAPKEETKEDTEEIKNNNKTNKKN